MSASEILARCDHASCVIFDCDGVVLDANPVKIEAFRAALADEDPTLVESFIAEPVSDAWKASTASMSLNTPSSWSPRYTDMIAGGASLAPSR